jgi:hypothetical protein
MATIRRRGKRCQVIVRRGQHSQAKTLFSNSDAEHWSKKLEIEIERSEAMLPNSADGVCVNELIDSYAKRCRQSKKGVGRTKSYNLRQLRSYFKHFLAQLTKHQLLGLLTSALQAVSSLQPCHVFIFWRAQSEQN